MVPSPLTTGFTSYSTVALAAIAPTSPITVVSRAGRFVHLIVDCVQAFEAV